LFKVTDYFIQRVAKAVLENTWKFNEKPIDVSSSSGIFVSQTTLMIQVIPSIAIRNGKVVKMRKGDPTSEKSYDENPLDLAKRFEDHGIEVIR
jgi:hypothetical protein